MFLNPIFALTNPTKKISNSACSFCLVHRWTRNDFAFFLRSGAIDGSEMGELTAGAASCSVFGLNGVPTVYGSITACRFSSGSYMALSLSSARWKVVSNKELARLRTTRFGSFVIAVSSGFDTRDLFLRLS